MARVANNPVAEKLVRAAIEINNLSGPEKLQIKASKVVDRSFELDRSDDPRDFGIGAIMRTFGAYVNHSDGEFDNTLGLGKLWDRVGYLIKRFPIYDPNGNGFSYVGSDSEYANAPKTIQLCIDAVLGRRVTAASEKAEENLLALVYNALKGEVGFHDDRADRINESNLPPPVVAAMQVGLRGVDIHDLSYHVIPDKNGQPAAYAFIHQAQSDDFAQRMIGIYRPDGDPTPLYSHIVYAG